MGIVSEERSMTSDDNNTQERREAEFKRNWINEHHKADELVCDAETKQPVAAIYYYAPTKNAAHMKKIWRMIGISMELKHLK